MFRTSPENFGVIIVPLLAMVVRFGVHGRPTRDAIKLGMLGWRQGGQQLGARAGQVRAPELRTRIFSRTTARGSPASPCNPKFAQRRQPAADLTFVLGACVPVQLLRDQRDVPMRSLDTSPVLIGQSRAIRQILDVIEKLRDSDAPVLLMGETGTGKEVVARTIHAAQGQGHFVPIDCSTLPAPLLETELFGHVRGAFTGAAVNKPGLVDVADGGTAFFDEVGELPLELQAKLLRLLQHKEFRPVGSVTPRKANFRVISATNRSLADAVRQGSFRPDLYYRLSVVEIHVPPLRERKEDIPLLVEHFLRSYARNLSVTPDCLDVMTAYDWPGNVRELENVVRRMAALSSNSVLDVGDLPQAVRGAATEKKPPAQCLAAAATAEMASCQVRRPPTMADIEKSAILQALEYTRGDRTMAAALLRIGRTTLYRKLKEYRLAG